MLHAEMGGGLGTRLILDIKDSISTWAYASIIDSIIYLGFPSTIPSSSRVLHESLLEPKVLEHNNTYANCLLYLTACQQPLLFSAAVPLLIIRHCGEHEGFY